MDFDPRPIRKEVLAALSQVPEVAKQSKEVAYAIRDTARQLVRVRTGNLKRRGIGVQRVYDRETRSVSYIVGWTPEGWYGWLLEAGTEDTAAAPHLVPAAIRHGAQAPRGGAALTDVGGED